MIIIIGSSNGIFNIINSVLVYFIWIMVELF